MFKKLILKLVKYKKFDENKYQLISYTRLADDYDRVMGGIARYELEFYIPVLFNLFKIKHKTRVRFFYIVFEVIDIEKHWNNLIKNNNI